MKADAPRALAGTVIGVVPREEQRSAADVLMALAQIAAIRPVVISLGDSPEPPIEHHDGAVTVKGLLPKYLNNVVASLRLSSLPTGGWWRSGQQEPLRDFAVLVDRLILDVDDPKDVWPRVAELTPLAAVTDVRWARVTRWRDLLAQFFDVPGIQRLERPFDRLEITGGDAHDSRLLAGWLRARLPGGASLGVSLRQEGKVPVQSVALHGGAASAALELLPDGTCVRATWRLDGDTRTGSRIVGLGARDKTKLLAEELRIRARDRAFEEAVKEALTL
jgi:glucose-6-phosphate dehydrogenase assembly protein OpcA